MKIYVLIENGKQKQSGFIAEHGISLYFEHGGKRILFDTGASDAFIYNATLLGVDLSKIDICVISHAHYDHTGGLDALLRLNSRVKVYMKRQASSDYYIKSALKYRRVGMDSEFFEKWRDRIKFIEEDAEIADGVYAVNADRYRRYPVFTSLMYKKEGEKYVHDDLSHELFLSVETPAGPAVLTGCSHHGILNILMTAEKKFGKTAAVVGGFHLNGAKFMGLRVKKEPASELRAIAKYLNNKGIKKAFTGHCTGEKPFEKLELITFINRIRSGDIIEI